MDLYNDKLNPGATGAEPKNHPAVREGFLCLPSDAFDAVIFDLDGTLVDSMGMWARIDVEFLGRFGLESPPDLQRKLEGLTWGETELYFEKNFPIGLSTKEIGKIWIEMAAEKYRQETPAKDGAVEFVLSAKQLGFKLGVASTNHMELILEALGAHGLTDSFDAITTCAEVEAGKPDPAVYLLTAKKLGVRPERCLIFEDIPVGILAGKRAGMTAIAVDDLNSAPMEAEKMRLADGYIHSYREIQWV
jgi:16S rRNA pseudouridine516 synthase